MATFGPRFDPKYQTSLDLWKKDPVALKKEYDRIANDKSIDINSPNTIGHLQRLGEFSALHKKSGNTIADINTDTGLEANPPVITGGPEKKEATPTTPTYTSPYSDDIGRTLAAIQNRQPFSYNPSTDQGLQAAQGQVMDAVSRAAARRNMIYSDSNKTQMGQAALELIPQFEDRAYNRYQGQGQEQNQLLNTLMGVENQQYGRFRDTVGDTRYADETGYARGRDSLGDARYSDETAYSRGRDAVGDTRYTEETAYNRDMDSFTKELQIAALNGTFRGKLTMESRQAIAALTGVDPETGQPTAQSSQFQQGLAQGDRQFNARMGQDASQFSQNLGQRQSEFDAEQNQQPNTIRDAIQLAQNDPNFKLASDDTEIQKIINYYIQLLGGQVSGTAGGELSDDELQTELDAMTK